MLWTMTWYSLLYCFNILIDLLIIFIFFSTSNMNAKFKNNRSRWLLYDVISCKVYDKVSIWKIMRSKLISFKIIKVEIMEAELIIKSCQLMIKIMIWKYNYNYSWTDITHRLYLTAKNNINWYTVFYLPFHRIREHASCCCRCRRKLFYVEF